jgi:hypothetical protein
MRPFGSTCVGHPRSCVVVEGGASSEPQLMVPAVVGLLMEALWGRWRVRSLVHEVILNLSELAGEASLRLVLTVSN